MILSQMVEVPVRGGVFVSAPRGLTRCEFLFANSQDCILFFFLPQIRAICAGCKLAFPPWPSALRALLCCGLPYPITWLLWKCPPPFSLFISSKLFEMRGVSQSQSSFPSTTACLRICQRGPRRAMFSCAQQFHKKFERSYSRFWRDWKSITCCALPLMVAGVTRIKGSDFFLISSRAPLVGVFTWHQVVFCFCPPDVINPKTHRLYVTSFI